MRNCCTPMTWNPGLAAVGGSAHRRPRLSHFLCSSLALRSLLSQSSLIYHFFLPFWFFSLASSLSPPSRDLEYKCNHTMMHGTLMIFFYLAYLFFSKMESTQSCLEPGSGRHNQQCHLRTLARGQVSWSGRQGKVHVDVIPGSK